MNKLKQLKKFKSNFIYSTIMLLVFIILINILIIDKENLITIIQISILGLLIHITFSYICYNIMKRDDKK